MPMEAVFIKPKEGETINQFLTKYGKLIPGEQIKELIWSEIDPRKLPVLLVVAQPHVFTYVLLNKNEYDKYHISYTDNLVRQWYLVNIEDMWENSNLNRVRWYIEQDRIHSRKTRGATLNAPGVKKQLMLEVGKNLYRTKTPKQIADELKLTTAHIHVMEKYLRNKGIPIPTVSFLEEGRTKRRHWDTDSCLAVLKNESPEIFDPNSPQPMAISNGNGHQKKRGRPKSSR